MDDDEPVSRADFERAMRHLNLSDLELRDAVLQLGARLVALTDELTRRIDGVEPDPAPPNTPAPRATQTVEAAAADGFAEAFGGARAADAGAPHRVQLDTGGDKYAVTPSTPPCDEVMHLCQARCCTFDFTLSTVDLDEGVLRWDYGRPYLIQQRTDGYCVHNEVGTHRCTVHAVRPRVCRVYDCSTDRRIWIDFEKRIPAPVEQSKIPPEQREATGLDLVERARARAAAIAAERVSMNRRWRR